MEGWKDLSLMLREAALYRQDHERKWRKWWDIYRFGDSNPRSDTKEEVRIYIARQVIQTLIPSLYFRNPYVITKPIVTDDPRAEEAAMCMEAWINYYIATIPNLKNEYRAAVLDALVTQKGYIENVWERVVDEIPVKNAGERLTYSRLLTDAPAVHRVSRYDLLIDPYAMTCLNEARWIARGFWVPTDAIVDNKAFNERVRKQFTTPDRPNEIASTLSNIVDLEQLRRVKNRAASIMDMPTIAGLPSQKGLVQLWRITDRKYNRQVIMSTSVEGFLQDIDNPYQHLPAFPVTEIEFKFDNDVDHADSMVQYLLDQQREITFIATRQHEAMKRFARMLYMYDNRFADPEGAERSLKSGQDGTVLHATEGQTPPINEVVWNESHPEWWALRESSRSTALDSVGIPPTSLGMGHEKFKTASEVNRISSQFDIRLDDLKEQVASWNLEAMSILGRNISVFLTDSKKFTIAGQPKTVGPSDIAGEEFTYELQVSEALPERPEKRLERLMMLYKMAQGDELLSRERILIPVIRAIGERNPRQYLANADANATGPIPANMPAGNQMGPSEEMMAMAPTADQAGITGGINDQQALLAALEAMGGQGI